MNDMNLALALKNPSNLASVELDEILAAQVKAVHYLRQFVPLKPIEKKIGQKNRVKGRRSNLKNLNNRI